MAMDDTQFHVQLTAILDTLLKKAVTDICALADKWNSSLQMEITLSKSENEDLKRKLQIMEENLSHRVGLNGFGENPNTNTKLSQSGSADCFKKLYECGQRTVESERYPKGGQWDWSPVLAGIKEEEMEISITGRAEGRLDASTDIVHTIHHTHTNHHISELKTESESITEHGSQNPEAECNEGITVDCEDETQDSVAEDGEHKAEHQSTQNIQLSPTTEGSEEEEEEEEEEEVSEGGDDERTNVQEQCDISHLVTPSLLDDTALFNSESTSSNCNVLVILEGNADLSTPASKTKHSDASETTVGHSSGKKKKGPRFICNICEKSLSSKYSLTVHYTLHTGDRPYACAQCGKRFVNKTNLQIHQNIHTGAKPYVCTLCPKSFSDPSPFGRHKRMHSRELQQSNHSPKCKFICNICGKSLSTKQGLTYHLTMHTGGRPFTCTWCGKSFVQKHNLKIHQNIHTGAKPYACTLCSKSFADPSSLKKHKRLHM
ncbi:zinc finger protein 2-like [Electrophorus electricus]|uniref:zinc finger protein 2-like n=1 Tax=Electrophorus electricus TaxID=8005 RepID=UPI0015D027DC|nr:zinc finger protein 2-like [Electrophorus electricus]